jgi:hypothetical protein
MKKVLSLLVIAGFTALVACGPSADEIAKQKADSTAKAQKAQFTADSLVKADSTAKAEAAAVEAKKLHDDSVAQGLFDKKDKTNPPKSTGTKTTPKTQVKAGQGKG